MLILTEPFVFALFGNNEVEGWGWGEKEGGVKKLDVTPRPNDDNEQRRKKLNLLSLEQRRFLFDVLFLYKVLNGYINIDPSTYVQFFSDSDRYP